MGLVSDVFTTARLDALPGDRAIGHVRYSTVGRHRGLERPALSSSSATAGPSRSATTATSSTRRSCASELEAAGSIFQSTSDTEVILHLYARSHRERPRGRDRGEPLQGAWGRSRCSSSRREALIAARDPLGLPAAGARPARRRPTIVASETCALDLIDAEYVRDVEPGEMRGGRRRRRALASGPSRRSPPRTASSSTSTSPGPTASSSGATSSTSRLRARPPARPRGARPRPTSSCPSPTAASAAALGYARGERAALRVGPHPQPLRGPHLHRAPAVDPLASASRSSSTRCARSSRASGSSSSTTPSCAARPRARSSRMVREPPARARSTCASRSPPTTGPCYYGIDTPAAGAS